MRLLGDGSSAQGMRGVLSTSFSMSAEVATYASKRSRSRNSSERDS